MKIIAALSLVLFATASSPANAAGDAVDVALVLAGDVSGSMAGAIQAQRDGLVAAFRDPEIATAIGSGALGRVAVTYVEWAGPTEQWVVVPWTIVGDAHAAGAFADQLAHAPPERGFQTAMSSGLIFAAGQFAHSNVTPVRRAIDVSGDGPNNAGPPIVPVRDFIVAQGITINGLPFAIPIDRGPFAYMSERPGIDLDAYFEDCVIGGPGAFAMPISGPSQYFAAIRRKLVMEIAGLGPPILLARFVPAAAPRNCPADGLVSQ